MFILKTDNPNIQKSVTKIYENRGDLSVVDTEDLKSFDDECRKRREDAVMSNGGGYTRLPMYDMDIEVQKELEKR